MFTEENIQTEIFSKSSVLMSGTRRKTQTESVEINLEKKYFVCTTTILQNGLTQYK